MTDPRARGRRTFLLLALLFFAPVIVAFVLYYGDIWRPPGSSSKGALIQPPRPLEVAGLQKPDGSPAPADALRGKWTLIYIGDGACDEACKDSLVYARQSRLALNNEMTRVQRVLLASDNCCDEAYLSSQHTGLDVYQATSPEAKTLLGQFPADRAHALFIVDPLGNLMMSHDTRDGTSKALLTDLKKLLKLSHIG
jgi:hypothetical protein